MPGIMLAGPVPSALDGANEAGFCGVTGVAGVEVGGCSASGAGVGGTLAVEPFFVCFYIVHVKKILMSNKLLKKKEFTFRSLGSFLPLGFALLVV